MADRGYNYVPHNVKTDRVVFLKDFVRENGGVMVWKIAHTIVQLKLSLKIDQECQHSSKS